MARTAKNVNVSAKKTATKKIEKIGKVEKVPAKSVTKVPVVKKASAPKPVSGTGGPARSALRGGHVEAERYSKDPSAVNARVSEKADRSIAQLANMIARFEAKGEDTSPEIKKARKAMEALESVKKVLA
jgi:hypothetical protein